MATSHLQADSLQEDVMQQEPGQGHLGWFGADPSQPGFKANPHPLYKHLREVAPVNLTPEGVWRLSRYEDIQTLLKRSHAGMRDTTGLIPGLTREQTDASRFMLRMDPPDHNRLRRLVSKAFTPAAIAAIRPLVQESLDIELDRVADQGSMDLIADLALPVPAASMCAMLGVPFSDRDMLSRWVSLATFKLVGGEYPSMQEQAEEAVLQLADYMLKLLEERRQNPGDDILSALVAAEEQGDRLDPDELLQQSIGLLVAGLETTIGLIGNGMQCFARNPDQFELLQQRPELIETAVEECLRFEPSVPVTIRILHEDTQFDEFVIPRDTRVIALLIGANRDPDVFTDPDRFDITRDEARHCSFGGGIHFCLGSHLARLNAEIAFLSMAERFTEIKLDDENFEWAPSLFRIPGKIPVTFRRR